MPFSTTAIGCLAVAERLNSAAASALSDKKLRRTNSAAAVGCGGWFGRESKQLIRPLGIGIGFALKRIIKIRVKPS